MSKLLFRKFESKDSAVFKALNVAWLKEYFEVEPYDEKVLGNPEEEIIAQGGHILMADFEGQPIGTFAYIKREESVYEFSKMAIAEAFRGKGYGNEMMKFSLHYAEKHHWKKLIIYSSRKLKNAIHLYRKYGYIEIPIEENAFYSRGDIKMELVL